MSVYTRERPFESPQERLVSEALASSQTDPATLRAIRPPLPQIELNPPRFGYPSYTDRALTLRDVIAAGETSYGTAIRQISGGQESMSGSERNFTGQANIGF